MRSTLGFAYVLILASRILRLLETFYRHALEYLQSARAEQKKKNAHLFYVNA